MKMIGILKTTLISVAIVAIIGCTTMTAEQSNLVGQVGGAAVGAALGSKVGDGAGKYAAMAAGVAIGAWIGGEIAKAISEKDKGMLMEQSQSALSNASDGQTVSWIAPESGKTITMTPGQAVDKDVDIEVRKLDQVQMPAGRLVVLDETRVAQKKVNLRTSTAIAQDNIIGTYSKGEKIRVTAQTADKKWYAVEEKGVLIGFIDAKSVQAAQAKNTKTSTSSNTIASAPTMKSGMDLDKLDAKPTKISATTTCRKMTYNLDTNTNTSENCKAPDGAWQVI